MGRASDIQNATNAGELSPLLLGRQDLSKYAHGLFICLNGIPLTQGAWTRRPGTLFLTQAKHHTKRCRLFPFQYSVTQTYVLEFGEQYIRFFSMHGILTNTTQSITSVSQANPGVVSKVAHGYTNGTRLYINNIVGMTQLNNREFVVANAAANTFELQNSDGTNVDTTGYGAFVSGSMASIFEVATDFLESDLSSIRIVQSADVLYILHPDYPTQILVRLSALSWSLSDLALTDGPYDNVNATTTTLTPSATSGAITITASAVTGINSDQGFLATDVGRLIRILHTSTWGYAVVTARNSATSVNATVLSNFGAATASANWRLGIWSDTTGFPAVGTFFEDRLFLGGTPTFPQRLDGSRTGRYGNFSPTANDGTIAADNAVAYVLNSNDVNAIRWMKDNEKGILVGTERGEWVVKASVLGEALSPTNISAKPATKHGSAAVDAVQASKAVLFVQRAGRKLREMAYVLESDGFRCPEMTLLAEHITRPSMTEMVYQEQPQAIAWIPRSDGVLLGFTYERDQDVVAWHRHELGGRSDAAGDLIPVVESEAVAPAPDTSRDELYLVVQRHVNGATKRYIELMTKIWETDDEQEDAFHLDCGWTVVNSPAASTVTGLWHLEGETVSIYTDGAVHPNATVTNGTLTLNYAASIVTLGFGFNSDAQTLPIEAGAQDGSAQGKIKRIHRVGFWLLDTLGLKYGPDPDRLTEILVRRWGDPMGAMTPLFTGVYRDRFEGDYDKLGQVYWRIDGPFPGTVMACMPQVNVSDDT